MASTTTAQAVASGDLVDLVSSSASATIYPNDDAILAVLQSRFRADLPYTRVGSTSLISVNPYKNLASTNDANAKEYEERCYKDTSLPLVDSPKPLQPHVYDFAARIFLLMRRKHESQAVVSRGITGSGKSFTNRLLVNQLLRLSTHSKKEYKLAQMIKALGPLLDSFGNAKTVLNPNASRHGRYLELHFTQAGHIKGAKVLTYGLDKSRLSRLNYEERSFHVFYQLLAGATKHERDIYQLEDLSDYALLASSGCYRLPAGPFSDDAIAMNDLRAAFRTLGFKPKHVSSIYTLLVAILLLGNIQFGEADAKDASAYVMNTAVLDQTARLLGIPAEDLGQALTNKTNYVRKELYTVLLSAEQAAAQRDSLARDLYSILFAFVVETANHKIAPSAKDVPPASIISILDQPGFQTRTPTTSGSMSLTGNAPLVSQHGSNAFDEFCINFADEVVQSYVLRNTFEDRAGFNSQITGDGVGLPTISTMDNAGCIELLRGAQLSERAPQKKPGGMLGVMSKACSAYKSGKSTEKKDEDLLQDLAAKFGVHASFSASPNEGSNERTLFVINHHTGACSYDVNKFVERDTDLLDAAFVGLLRGSSDSFVAKLLAGPSLAAERHSRDESTIVYAQVSTRPLREPTPIPSPTYAATPSEEAHPRLDPNKVYPVTTQINYSLSELVACLDKCRLWNISCIRPNDSGSPNSFDKRRVRAQIRSLLLADQAARKSVEYVASFEQAVFCERYVPTMRGTDGDRIRQCAAANGWKEGEDYAIGHREVWLTYRAFKMAEDPLREAEKDVGNDWRDSDGEDIDDNATEYTQSHAPPETGSDENLLAAHRKSRSMATMGTSAGPFADKHSPYGAGGLETPGVVSQKSFNDADSAWDGYDQKDERSPDPGLPYGSKEAMVVNKAPDMVEEVPTSRSRRIWLIVVKMLTWWIPGFLLRTVGRMKRPDVRLAWREKLTIFFLIFLLNATMIFYIVEFGRLLCPNFDKAWASNEVAEHTGSNDFWVSVAGQVYDVSNFVHGDHSDITGEASNGEDALDALAGQEMTNYFPPPLTLACPQLVTDPNVELTYKNFTPLVPTAVHVSGSLGVSTSKLHESDWYTAVFQPAMKQFHKGPLVWDWSNIESQASDEDNPRLWAVWDGGLYDLTDYENTVTLNAGSSSTSVDFLDDSLTSLFKNQAGQDITKEMNVALGDLDATTAALNVDCLKNSFYLGEIDFRKSARCQVQNFMLLVFTIILVSSVGLKFLAALQLSPKRNPELLDKFVLCQVPCYTEGEDSLRRTIDSLASLNYDDKRKLIFVICDGNIIGSGNDRTTPRIVLDILGVDPKLDPEPLLFKSVGEGSKQLNYGKVYSGLYEFEGHVVPYMVVVKVGKPTERSKPGNRGKRDSQVLMMRYLNRVHFDAPMNPLELEIYHQMRNVIGIDPAFYEYIFTVDADTTVTGESLNRLVASAADDSSIIGICGETKLENEEGSWWTMIQVYEYYISHHLSKAFESLFGSVTCLPGCFSLYRIRTADKGRPILISNRIIDEYSVGNVDTLHKKNLFSLGEDRYLTTLMLKHFPTFKTKFIGDAVAHTMAPESWRVLFSQRRRWINSTVHNLCELVFLPELFGFCCFSMRFFVFIDLLGTLILPATVVYLVYLIITVATGHGAFPTISIIMLGVTYGLQATIFIIKREFMLVGWMVVYLLSYPVYSFFLPVYSFWCMDEFGWGNTRLVVGEGNRKKVIVTEDDRFDESMIPLKRFSEYEAETWDTASHHSGETYKTGYSGAPKSGVQPPSRQQSPARSYQQASQSGDYYRDTNLTYNNSSNPNLRLPHQPSQPSLRSNFTGSQYGGPPQLPHVPIGGGPGSAAGSDYGSPMPFMLPLLGYQNTGSMYGAMPGAPRNTMMPTGTSVFGASASQLGGLGAPTPPAMQRPMSTFSMATTANLFAAPSTNENPSDEELFMALRHYLSTQDLMTVTKKTTREAITARYPAADLSSRKDFLNKSIDQILSQT